jgi:putative DNA modification/repair radical SAM protein
MPQIDLKRKLSILADAAKYDASCASSAAPKRHSLGGKGIGSTEGSGICHAYAPDGRCISLLKVLLTNYCMFDCAYCVNRISSNVERARFRVSEIVALTLDFYRRNYIEGLFLSSGIIRSPDYTMEQMIAVARTLREDHDFRGYIHLKSIPEADPLLIEEAGRYADRLSLNVELPTERALGALAPEKKMSAIRQSMGRLRLKLDEAKAAKAESAKAPRFATGQSTQVIVGADVSTDADILRMSGGLYANYALKRVYYSAFSPIPDASTALPLAAPPLMREHRLYQADWLYRFYGFSVDEIVSAAPGGMFDPAIDPKLAWALANRALFPVDINRAPKEMLLRVPGIGATSVKRILATRQHKALRLDDLQRLKVSLKVAQPFVTALDWQPGRMLDEERLKERLKPAPQQLSLLLPEAA